MALVLFRGFQTNRLNCEHFLRNISSHIWTIDCVMTSHSKDKEMQTATKPQTKIINVLACGLLGFLASKWLFSCNTIRFQKYLRCSQFSWFNARRLVISGMYVIRCTNFQTDIVKCREIA